MELFDLTGKVALVTGAARGLGRTCALGLAQAGATVAVVTRKMEEAEALAAEIRDLGGQASGHTVEMRSIADIRRMVDEVATVHGRVDILLSNAGTKIFEDVLSVTEESWDTVLDVNLKGAFFCAQAAARLMVGQGAGKIINMASTYSVVVAPTRGTYAISKGGLLQMTRVMAVELAPRGVNVNAIGPTAARTKMNESVFSQEEWRNATLSRIPAGRFCEPEDIVGAVIFLASSASKLVHGHLLLVDGGFTAI